MSDAVHVTIDDLLFVIGPNTTHMSSLEVRKSIIDVINVDLSFIFRIILTTRTTMTIVRIPSGIFNGVPNAIRGLEMHKEKKRGKLTRSRERNRQKNLRNRLKNRRQMLNRKLKKRKRRKKTENL